MGILLFFLISFLSFFQSTLSGGGASLLLMPLLSMLLGGIYVAPVMTIGTSITGVSRIWMFRNSIDWDLVKWYAIPSSIAAFAGAYILVNSNSDWIQLIIGIFLILSIFQFINKARSPQKSEETNITNSLENIASDSIDINHDLDSEEIPKTIGMIPFLFIGIFVAFLSGLIGGVGPLMNIIYLKYGLSKEKLLGTRTANEMLIHIVKIITYFTLGNFPFIVIFCGTIIGVSGIIGSFFGKMLLSRISNVWFLRIVLFTMVVSGAIMIWQSWDFAAEVILELKSKI
ncbi:sulfite exporter TauE/SafE family protein [Leptospira sp. GIMC2001]|uniref:sulfite exporter TauE/SafE family protein n=1 Tax=Leptospira sp. GIMC2001 TaxID=1513297 RepID=UPI00234B2D01|nr:sulfite exporter TauE/SafE family protein [Leptospira sp. GIMC2001]WCL49801.1 sulfite exporter TauE/SafE family protein [Leptospira sp. GIMC2001]